MSETKDRTDERGEIHRGSRVRYRGDYTGPVGRVIETTHHAAVVLWAPTVLDTDEARFVNARRGSSSLRDLELCE